MIKQQDVIGKDLRVKMSNRGYNPNVPWHQKYVYTQKIGLKISEE